MKEEQASLFDMPADWEKDWEGMPEYNNVDIPSPEVSATFRFKNREDFEKFHEVVKKHLYNNERVFDGMQGKNKKSTWYPLKEKASKYKYV